MALTPKQQRFCEEYVIDLNATQAAIRAGYSEKTAYSQGQRLLNNVEVAAAIQLTMDKRANRVKVNGDRVLEEIGHSAFIDPAKYFDENGNLLTIRDMPEDVRRSISTIKVRREKGDIDPEGKQLWDTITELKVNDKTRNLELYGKHLKLFTEKVEHSGVDGKPIEFSNTERAARLAAILERGREERDRQSDK